MTDDITRRDVLRGLGGIAIAGAIGCDDRESGQGQTDQAVTTCSVASIAAVENQARPISTVAAYAEKSVAAGGTIKFRVSSPVPYQLSIVRLGWDTTTTEPFPFDSNYGTAMPAGDWTMYTFPQFPASPQFIHPGSYIHVQSALDPNSTFAQLTLEIWVRPFRTQAGGYWQGLMSQYTNPGHCGFILGLTDANVPFYYFGNGGTFGQPNVITGTLVQGVPAASSALSAMQWHHLVAVFNAGTAILYVDGVQVGSATMKDSLGNVLSVTTPSSAPLRIGAYGDSTGTSFFYDGDLAMPVIWNRALSPSEIASRASTMPPQAPNNSAVIGCWPLTEEAGPNVADVSGCGRTGTIVNHGAWMIGGPGFDASLVGRYDSSYNPDDPVTAAARGHGLRLSWSDLFDCAWLINETQINQATVNLSYTLPTDCLPGIYVGRIIYTDNFTNPNNPPVTRRYDVTFVVRGATTRPCAPVLVLANTNTWHAYNNVFQLHSFYDNHAAGQPTYYQGFQMPWTFSRAQVDVANNTSEPGGADPYLTYDGDATYGHLVHAERFWHVWLERNGYDYDVIGDRDLDSSPSILSNYKTVFIIGHSEYWTKGSWCAVQSYVASGGKLIVASGNTMFWRVSYDSSAIECRKKGQSGGERPNAQWGELYHEHDHQRGGLMREAGYPGWQVTGLDTSGASIPLVGFQVTNAAHALFQTPEAIAVQGTPGNPGTPLGGSYGAGHEWDATLQTLSVNPATMQPPSPLPPSPPSNYTPSLLAQAKSSVGWDYRINEWSLPSPQNPATTTVVSEIVEWVWSGGGRVFSAGSIAAGQAVNADPNMSALFRNALHANGVKFKLNVMAIGQDGHFDMKAFDGSTWSTGWTDQGGGFANNPPTGVQWAPNSLAAMAIASNGHFYYYYNTGSVWSPINDYGYGSAPFVGRPAAVGWGRNRLDLFARDTNGHVWQKSWDGSTFSGWVDRGGSLATDPAAINSRGRLLSLAVLNTSGNAMHRLNSNGNWGGWTNLGGVFASAPTMVFSAGNRMNMFAVDNSGVLWWNASDPVTTNDAFGGWVSRGSPPSVALNGRVQVACWGEGNAFTVFGIGVNGHLYGLYWDGSNWGSWTDLGSGLGGPLIGEPAVASYRGGYISVLCTATNGHIQHRLWDGSAWQAWQDFGGTMLQSPAVFRWVGT